METPVQVLTMESTPVSSIFSFISDKNLSLAAPVIAYWLYSLVFTIMDAAELPFFEKYRIHTPQELTQKNKASKRSVLQAVVFQQIVQTGVGLLLMLTEPDEILTSDEHQMDWLRSLLFPYFATISVNEQHLGASVWMIYHVIVPAFQFFLAFFFLDTWQYFWHRFMHRNKFMFKHLHSLHHKLYVPYAFGALYNHPLEGLLMDTIGASLAFKFGFMSVRQGIFFFAFSTMKTVDDHSGYVLPFDPFQIVFSNNAKYHDIHHQHYGIKKNFSQPFFTFWDRALGTYMPVFSPRMESCKMSGEGTQSL